MADKSTQILLDDERKRKLEMIAVEEGHSQSAAVRGMIDRRYSELFVTVPKVDRVAFASGKIITHAPAHAPVEAFPPSQKYVDAMAAVEEKELVGDDTERE